MPRWPAFLFYGSTALRQRALRPQLKRDPLGGGSTCIPLLETRHNANTHRRRIAYGCDVRAYLGLSLSWRDADSILRGLHFLLIVAAALAVIWGTFRRATWAPKLAIALAALAGIPNFMFLGALIEVYVRAGLSSLLLWSWITVANLAQLVALVIALRRVRVGDAAA